MAATGASALPCRTHSPASSAPVVVAPPRVSAAAEVGLAAAASHLVKQDWAAARPKLAAAKRDARALQPQLLAGHGCSGVVEAIVANLQAGMAANQAAPQARQLRTTGLGRHQRSTNLPLLTVPHMPLYRTSSRPAVLVPLASRSCTALRHACRRNVV